MRYRIRICQLDANMPDLIPSQPSIRSCRMPELKILIVSKYDNEAYGRFLNAGVDGYHMKDQPLADLQL
jgi:DNA-binding NarL/FixJ family response regulator